MTYDEAVLAAQRIMAALEGLDRTDRRLRHGLPSLRDESAALQGYAMLMHDPALFMRVMPETAGGMKMMKKTAGYCVREGLEMPPAFAAWAARFLFGLAEEPHKGAGRRLLHKDEAAQWRHFAICEAVAWLVAHGFNATRNDTSPPLSACDAVAEARRGARMAQPHSYKGVRRVWLARVAKE